MVVFCRHATALETDHRGDVHPHPSSGAEHQGGTAPIDLDPAPINTDDLGDDASDSGMDDVLRDMEAENDGYRRELRATAAAASAAAAASTEYVP